MGMEKVILGELDPDNETNNSGRSYDEMWGDMRSKP